LFVVLLFVGEWTAVGFLQDAYDVIAAVGLLLGVRHYDVISLLDDVIMYCTCM
jgi:hypothetical protein